MIKAIFFDSGNVLVREGYRPGIEEYEKKYGIPTGKLYEAAHAQSWKRFTLGYITENDYLLDVAKNFDGELDTNELKNIIYSRFISNAELLDFIRTLHEKFILGVISNNPKEWFDFFVKTFGWDEIFQVKAVSSYTHIRKPDPEIFQYALDQAKVKADESIYIDDRPDIIQGAESLGINIIIYKNVDQFKKTLNNFINKYNN